MFFRRLWNVLAASSLTLCLRWLIATRQDSAATQNAYLAAAAAAKDISDFQNNWVVIVDSSRFYTNYRHAANAVAVYHAVRRLGIPDSRILLMLADDVACSPRNPAAGTMLQRVTVEEDIYGPDIQVDFRGIEVTAESVRRVLTGKQLPWTPAQKRLLSDAESHIFVFLTGHGGDGFLKFHDFEELTAEELADVVFQMHLQKRYKRLMFFSDTCQAGTLFKYISSPSTVAVGCSRKGQNSYSHRSDSSVGAFIIDRFTHHVMTYLNGLTYNATSSFEQLLKTLTPGKLGSEVDVVVRDLGNKTLRDFPLTSFWGSYFSKDSVSFREQNPLTSGFPLLSAG